MPQHKASLAKAFLPHLARARELFSIFVEHGSSRFNPKQPLFVHAQPVPHRNVDTRDLTSYLFLEAAAKFEGFCLQAFKAEIVHWYGVTSVRADFVMGSPDNGTERTFGWADPKRLHERGQHLFPAYRYFGDFKSHTGAAVYDRLVQAHKVRNRMAHDPSVAIESINKLAAGLGVPLGHQNGLSVGRLLLEYPLGSTIKHRFFFVFLDAYEQCAQSFKSF
jgi:hypothetical protein